MTVKQCLSAVVIAAIVGGLMPGSAWAGQSGQVTGDRPIDLRASIDRAAARVANDQSGQTSTPKSSGRAAKSMQSGSGGGGGGHMMAIVSLVSVAAGIGATYYMVKQIQKTTTTVPPAQ